MLHGLARQPWIQQQIRQVRTRVQRSADDAATSPDPPHGFKIKVIIVLVRSNREKRQALGVDNNHSGKKRVAQLREERVAVVVELPDGSLIDRAEIGRASCRERVEIS